MLLELVCVQAGESGHQGGGRCVLNSNAILNLIYVHVVLFGRIQTMKIINGIPEYRGSFVS